MTSKLVTQVAVEAVVNSPSAYDRDTIEAVREAGREAGVSSLYLDMLPVEADTDDGNERANPWLWKDEGEQGCGCAPGTPSARIGTSDTFACLGCGVHA